MRYYGGHQGWYSIDLDVNRKPTESHFAVNLSAEAEDLDFKEAAYYTARLISKNYDNLYVGMSGGLDSEFIAEVLYNNNIQFTPIIVVRIDSTDHQRAIDWCKSRSITYLTVKFDQSDLARISMKLAKESKLYFSNYTIIYYLAEIVGNTGGLIVGEPTIGNDDNDSSPIGNVFGMHYGSFILDIFFPGQHPGAFFMYTPELLLAYTKYLNTALSDSESRAILYEIPHRPKFEPMLHKQKLIDNISYINELDQYSQIPNGHHVLFDKQELIDRLTGL